MKKILLILLILGLIGLFGLNVGDVKAENSSIEKIIKQVFNERVELLSSKDLEEFDKKTNESRTSLLFFFIDKEMLDDSILELRDLYGMAEGYGEFEIVSVVPLIRIYRTDIKDNVAVSYVQQGVDL